MSDRSEARKRRKELKLTAQVAKKERLLEGVAQPESPVDEGERRFTIGHHFYREDLCKIKSMDATPLRKVLEAYKKMCGCVTEAEILNLPMDMKSIRNNGHYKKYFSRLTPDTELNEFDASSYRGFFFVDRTARVVQMVAVDVHPEDKKLKK